MGQIVVFLALFTGKICFAANPVANDMFVEIDSKISMQFTLDGTDSDGDSLVYVVDNQYGEITRGTTGHTVSPSSLSAAPNSSGRGVLDGPGSSTTEAVPTNPLNINTSAEQTGFTFEGIYRWDATGDWQNLFYIYNAASRSVRIEAGCGVSGHKFRFTFWDNNSGNPGQNADHRRYANITDVACNNWIHLAASYNGNSDSNSLKLYVNGQEYTSTYSNPTLSGPVGGLIISGVPYINSQGDNTNRLNAYVDEVRIWDRSRTATEILSNFNKELLGSESGLVYYNRFNWEDRFVLSGSKYTINHATFQTAHGYVSISGSVATYTPNAGFVGSDSFTYRVIEHQNSPNADHNSYTSAVSGPGTVNINVTESVHSQDVRYVPFASKYLLMALMGALGGWLVLRQR